MKQAASACFKAGIKDAKGKECNHKTIRGWLHSLKRSHSKSCKENRGGSQEPPRKKPSLHTAKLHARPTKTAAAHKKVIGGQAVHGFSTGSTCAFVHGPLQKIQSDIKNLPKSAWSKSKTSYRYCTAIYFGVGTLPAMFATSMSGLGRLDLPP